MRCVIQRVSSASVSVGGSVVGAINKGLVVLVGITHTDTEQTADWMAEKILAIRIFPDSEGKMNRSVVDIGGGVLLVSQFTLYGDLRKGTRPSFIEAARPEHAEPLYNYLLERLKSSALPKDYTPTSSLPKDHTPTSTSSLSLTSQQVIRLESGVFGAMMDVALVNDGPVTIVVER